MMLADAAQVVDGKIYMLGGGWSVMGPDPVPAAVAVKIEVPWDQANTPHKLRLALRDADGNVVAEIGSDFEVGRPPGLPAGMAIDVSQAINHGPLAGLVPGQRYEWSVTIDDESRDDWGCAFFVRPRPQAQAA
jgi:hypothetical protein